MKLSCAGWRRWKNDYNRRTCRASPVRPKRCAGSSDFPKRPILAHRDSSLCCKRRLKVVGCKLETGTDSSNPLPSPRSLRFEAFSRDDDKSARIGTMHQPHRHRIELTCRVHTRHFDFLSVGEEFGADCLGRTRETARREKIQEGAHLLSFELPLGSDPVEWGQERKAGN
jgi:hypothetical protein